MLLGAEERLTQLEYSLFLEIREKLAAELPRIQRSAAAVARADALYSLGRGSGRRELYQAPGEPGRFAGD